MSYYNSFSMSERIKYTLKQLKRPDKFRQMAIDMLEKSQNYFDKIVYGFIILILILIAIYFININRHKNMLEANKMFETGLEEYNSGKIDQALDTFGKIEDKYPGQKSASLAMYYSGLINFDIANFEKSADILTGYLNKAGKDKLLRESSLFTIGLSYFNLGKWDDAIKYLSQLENKNSPYESKAMLHIGMAYENKGNFDKSEEYYKKVLNDNTNNIPGGSVPQPR